MSASADVLALASAEFDLSGVEKGTTMTMKWRGRPVFIRHRTEGEIHEARSTDLSRLPDPERDEDRATDPEW